MADKKAKTNLSPSRLKHMRMLIESNTELSDRQKEYFINLIDKQMPDNLSDFAEFHTWIKKGDMLLTSMLQEMTALRQVTSEDADLISRKAVLQILDSYRVPNAANDVDESINWVLDKIQQKIATLYAKEDV